MCQVHFHLGIKFDWSSYDYGRGYDVNYGGLQANDGFRDYGIPPSQYANPHGPCTLTEFSRYDAHK